MSYYQLLNLSKEPFSTSPDPEFLYKSESHQLVLNKLDIAIRLRRGLSVVLGDVGTGKTTISRALIQKFSSEDDFVFHMVLAPTYKTELQFLKHLCKVLGIEVNIPGNSAMNYLDAIEKYLFKKGVEENKTVVLLIDEGQNLNTKLIEVLRVLLNYETNEHKLLELVIMAQMEFIAKIVRLRNFMDRIAFKYILPPLDEAQTKSMIEFRLKQAGYASEKPLFADEAVSEIYAFTKGYPRKITAICHNAIEYIVMNEESQVNGEIIKLVIEKERTDFTIKRGSQNIAVPAVKNLSIETLQ